MPGYCVGQSASGGPSELWTRRDRASGRQPQLGTRVLQNVGEIGRQGLAAHKSQSGCGLSSSGLGVAFALGRQDNRVQLNLVR